MPGTRERSSPQMTAEGCVAARRSLGMTQRGLAQALGYRDPVSVSRWERGIEPVPPAVALAIRYLASQQPSGLSRRFTDWCTSRGVHLQSGQQAAATALLDEAARNPAAAQLLLAAGGGRKFTLRQLELFLNAVKSGSIDSGIDSVFDSAAILRHLTR